MRLVTRLSITSAVGVKKRSSNNLKNVNKRKNVTKMKNVKSLKT